LIVVTNNVACSPGYDPVLEGDPGALVLVTPHYSAPAWAE
jgi:hypothetical protein